MAAAGETPKSVLIAGATGLVGRECVRQFVAHPAFERVVAVVRRPLPPELRLPKVQEHVVGFDRLAEHAELFRVTHVLSALGTTLKQAGSKARFRHVDYDYALAVARLGAEHGARHLLLVSSLGADSGSRIFYSRVKGELEDAVLRLPYRSITVARPSLLLGDRGKTRLGEEIGKRLAFLTPRKYKPVEGTLVAAALLRAAVEDRPGPRIIESADLRRTAIA
jgi:uncharacterized protein YbjT (DUF2867 family)